MNYQGVRMSRLELGKDLRSNETRQTLAEIENRPDLATPRDTRSALVEFDSENMLTGQNSTEFLRFVSVADEQLLQGHFEQAQRLYLAALREPHLEGEVLFNVFKNLGNIALQMADKDGAAEFYHKAYTLNPDSDVLMVNLGSLAIQCGQLDMAVRRFRRAVELNLRNDKAWTGLAVVHREFGDSELAWANIESALDANPGNSTAIRLAAEWGHKENELERSVRLLQAYLRVNDKDALMHFMLAKFFYFYVRLEESAYHARKAIELDPSIESGREFLNIIQEEIGARAARLK